MFPSQRLVVAIDGGQSSTLALVATTDGHILGSGLAGPSNHIQEPGGMARLQTAMTQSIGTALHSAGGSAVQVSHLCMGTTSFAIPETRDFIAEMFPATQVQVHPDLVTALAGATILRPGIVVIAGTGSVAYGRLADGRATRAGGWGYLMGDEGSAYSIGRMALQMASQAVDRRGAATSLVQRIPAYFKLESIEAVRDAVYGPAVTRPQIAGLSAVVSEAARHGDVVALSLLTAAGRDLAEIALAVMRQLDALHSGLRVYGTGGVFRAGALVMTPFRETLLARASVERVELAEFGPVCGALFMALQAAEMPLDDRLLQTVRDTLPAAAISKHREEESG